MLNCNQKITESSGVEWLLVNDPEIRLKAAPSICNVRAYARKLLSVQERPCGMLRLDELDEEGLSLSELLASPEQEEMPAWRTEVLPSEFESLLDLVREGGTAALAKKLGCTQRAVQMKLKALVEEGWHAQASLF